MPTSQPSYDHRNYKNNFDSSGEKKGTVNPWNNYGNNWGGWLLTCLGLHSDSILRGMEYPPLPSAPSPTPVAWLSLPVSFRAPPLPNTEGYPTFEPALSYRKLFWSRIFPQNPCQFYPLPLRLPEWSDLYPWGDGSKIYSCWVLTLAPAMTHFLH